MGTVVMFRPRQVTRREAGAERAYVTDARVLGSSKFALLQLRRSADDLEAETPSIRGHAARLVSMARIVARHLTARAARDLIADKPPAATAPRGRARS